MENQFYDKEQVDILLTKPFDYTDGEILDKTIYKINNIEELRKTEGKFEGQVIELLGYYNAGEYSLKYKWTNIQGIDDEGSVINNENGSWVALFDDELIDLKYYGVKDSDDCYNALNTILTKFGKVKGSKEYLLNTPLTFNANSLDLEFDLSLKTTIPINKAVLTINNPRSIKGIINCDLTESTSFFLDINNASEVDIKSNSINSKQTEGSSKYNYFIRINESYKAIVRGGNFTNMNPIENGLVGDTDGSARAILFTKVNNGEIYDNVFNDIRGYEDGEAVHIQTSVNNNKWKNSKINIHKNTFNNIYKRGIKLQASGCEVYNNEFNSSSYSEDTLNITRSAVSSYGNDNKIYSNTGNLKFAISVFDLSTDNTVSNNQIYNNSITLNSELLRNTLITRPAYVLIDKGYDILISNNIFKGSGCVNLTSKLENSNILSNQIDGGLMVSSNSVTSNTNIKGNFLNIKGTGASTFPYDTLQIANPINVTITNNILINSIVGLRIYGVIGSGVKYYMNEFILSQSGFSNLNIASVTSGTIISIPDNLYDKNKVLDFNNEGFYQTTSSFNLNTLNGSNGYGLVSVNCINVPPYPELTANLWRVETQKMFSGGDLLQTATSFRKNNLSIFSRIYNNNTSTWSDWVLISSPKLLNQNDSTATTVELLKTDFNNLLAKLKSAGIMSNT